MDPTNTQLTKAFCAEAKHQLAYCVRKIRHCLKQLSDDQVWWRSHETQNSIANIVLHMCGNLKQWIEAGIGGAVDARDRPLEFSDRSMLPKDGLLRRLEDVVQQAEVVLDSLAPSQLLEARRIQRFDVTVLGAIFHTVPHLVGHTHQIIYITRLQLGDAYQFDWTPLTPAEGVPI